MSGWNERAEWAYGMSVRNERAEWACGLREENERTEWERGMSGRNERSHFTDIARMRKSRIKTECTDYVHISTSWAVSWIVTRRYFIIIHRTFSIGSFFRLVGWPTWACLAIHWGAALSEDVARLLDLSFPTASSPKACWVFWMVWAWVSPSIWQNLMQYLYSMCSAILRENVNATWATTCLYISRNSREPAQNLSHMRRKGGVTSQLQNCEQATLVLAGKIKSDTFRSHLELLLQNHALNSGKWAD